MVSNRQPIARGLVTGYFASDMTAEIRWRRLRGFEYLAKIVQGVKFRDGIEVKQYATRLRQKYQPSRVVA